MSFRNSKLWLISSKQTIFIFSQKPTDIHREVKVQGAVAAVPKHHAIKMHKATHNRPRHEMELHIFYLSERASGKLSLFN
jgi:hypothetical protein